MTDCDRCRKETEPAELYCVGCGGVAHGQCRLDGLVYTSSGAPAARGFARDGICGECWASDGGPMERSAPEGGSMRAYMSDWRGRPRDITVASVRAESEAGRILAETERPPRIDVISGHHQTNANLGRGHALWQEADAALADALTTALAEWPESCGRRWTDSRPDDRTPRRRAVVAYER